MLLKQKQLCQRKENKWNTKASYYKAFQSLIKTIVCGISKNISGVVDLKDQEEIVGRSDGGRGGGKGKGLKEELQDNVAGVWRQNLLIKTSLMSPVCPLYKEVGGEVSWTGGSQPLLLLAVLGAPKLVSKCSAFETTRFSIRESFHKYRCSWRMQLNTCCLLLSIQLFTTKLETKCQPRKIPGPSVFIKPYAHRSWSFHFSFF